MRNRELCTILLLIVGMIFLPSGARGQAVTATLVGSIIDPGGAVVPNAPVSITNQDTGASLSPALLPRL